MANQIIEDLKNKVRSGNPVTRLIFINVSVFLFVGILTILTLLTGESAVMVEARQFIIRNVSMPTGVESFLQKPWTLITYMFTQLDIFHILWNMVALYWFGQILTEYTNPKKIVPLYLMGGLMGGILALLVINLAPVFHRYEHGTLIGSSAGVTAIIVAAATLVPQYRMNLLFVGPVKLVYLAIFVIFIDFLNLASHSNVGGNLAHLGGALMGFIYIQQYKRGIDWAKPFNSFFALFRKGQGTRMRIVHKKKLSDEEYNYTKVVNQQMVDAILDKISRSGYESLTKSEKEILFKASKK
jgi:membrane associated rhomboid family serine protease